MDNIESISSLANAKPYSENRYEYLCFYLIRNIKFLDQKFKSIKFIEEDVKKIEAKKKKLIKAVVGKRALMISYKLLRTAMPGIRRNFMELENSIHGQYVIEYTDIGQEYKNCKEKYAETVGKIEKSIAKFCYETDSD